MQKKDKRIIDNKWGEPDERKCFMLMGAGEEDAIRNRED